jgi:hypothetical protein
MSSIGHLDLKFSHFEPMSSLDSEMDFGRRNIMMNSQFLQGDLQTLFDVLYTMGVIDPVLKMDWVKVNEEIVRNQDKMVRAMVVVNSCGGDQHKLQSHLNNLDQSSLSYLAMEVAREFAEYQDRKELH